jgi:glycosyltransferase involved in cell wall biosynthesis
MSVDEGPVYSGGHGPLRLVVNGLHAKSGGGVTYLRNIIPELAEMPDLELHLFLHKDQFELFYPVSEKAHVTLLDFRPTFLRTLLWEQVSVPLIAWGMGADIVFSPANYGPVFARNHVILLSNAVSVIQLTAKMGQLLYWLMLSGATLVSLLTAKRAIAVSNYAKKLLSFRFSAYLGKKIRVVYHGTHRVKPDKVYSPKPGANLLAVSDIYIQKNYHTLLHALAILIKRHPELRLDIAGREIDHTYTQSLRTLTRQLEIEENVTFRGHVNTDELMELYQGCKVFVFPSTVETFGLSLLEAMAAGAPIACSNKAAMPEVLGDTGLFFDPDNKNNMADTIEKLLSDDRLRLKMGEKARRRARSFSWKNSARQTYSVLKEAAEPRPETARRVR